MTGPDRPRPRFGALAVLVVVTVLAGVTAGAIGAAVQSAAARSALENEIAERNLALALELAIRSDFRIQSQIELLEIAATRREVSSLGDRATADLRAILGSANAYDELYLHDATGRAVAAAASTFLASPVDVPDRPASTDRTQPSVRVVAGPPPELEVGVTVDDPPGTPNGTLVGRLSFDVISQAVLRVDQTTTAARFLVDGDGVVLVNHRREFILEQRQLDLGSLLDDAPAVGDVVIDGLDYIAATAPLTMIDAYAVVMEERSAAMAPVSRQLQGLTLILLVVIAATVLAVVAAASWLLAPLGPLVTAVRRLGHEQLDVRVAERGVGEVAAVASEFNRLAAALDERRRQMLDLQRLSILVGSRSSRDDVAAEVVDGAVRLTSASWAAFCDTAEDGPPSIRAGRGEVDEAVALEASAIVRRDARTRQLDFGSGSATAVPIRTIDGAVDAVLVVCCVEVPVAEDEVRLLDVYSAFTGVALDNVARLSLQQELAAELADAAEHRRHLIGSVSHELRTPVASIRDLIADLLERWDALGEDGRLEQLRRIDRDRADLDDVIGRVLDLALVERGSLDARIVPVRLDEVVESALASAAPLLADRPVTVDVGPWTVHADRNMLQRALANLLSNAVKYSPAGSAIEIAAIAEGDRIRLEVTDNGIGLTAEEAIAAFTPFWRSVRVEARAVRGAGLGLALVAEYARAMGGDVGVLSEPGHGSTFILVLRRGVDADAVSHPMG